MTTVTSRPMRAASGAATLDVPDHYLLECRMRLDTKAELTIAGRPILEIFG